MNDRRIISKWHKEIFIHCIKRKKTNRPITERRKKMDHETCPKCEKEIYGREGKFKCYLCGDFKKNYNTGKLELVLYNETTKEEK
ncbi:MAG: hypothetical protein UR99_C0017G0018 [Candidatus Moranbacteria bacterium GW2011_GWD2_36_12]|nr:MAG: hypothetical protein UR99_C0017G0018 [Candidatus Moranbacteria bacterium GW2011_GWD2_36_12]